MAALQEREIGCLALGAEVGAVRCSDAEAASGWKGSQAVRGGQGLHSFAEQH